MLYKTERNLCGNPGLHIQTVISMVNTTEVLFDVEINSRTATYGSIPTVPQKGSDVTSYYNKVISPCLNCSPASFPIH